MQGSRVLAVDLAGDSVKARNGSMVAYDGQMTFKRMSGGGEGLRGASEGHGLFTTKVEGQGWAAVTSDGPAVILRVAPGLPLRVDPGAYIAHTGNLKQSFRTDVTWRAIVGETGGESFQIEFEGDGLVYVQPSERRTFAGDA